MYDLLIFYRKLVDAVKDEIYGERRQKIKERQEKIKIKEHHKRILDLNLPTEVVSTDDKEVVVGVELFLVEVELFLIEVDMFGRG